MTFIQFCRGQWSYLYFLFVYFTLFHMNSHSDFYWIISHPFKNKLWIFLLCHFLVSATEIAWWLAKLIIIKLHWAKHQIRCCNGVTKSRVVRCVALVSDCQDVIGSRSVTRTMVTKKLIYFSHWTRLWQKSSTQLDHRKRKGNGAFLSQRWIWCERSLSVCKANEWSGQDLSISWSPLMLRSTHAVYFVQIGLAE